MPTRIYWPLPFGAHSSSLQAPGRCHARDHTGLFSRSSYLSMPFLVAHSSSSVAEVISLFRCECFLCICCTTLSLLMSWRPLDVTCFLALLHWNLLRRSQTLRTLADFFLLTLCSLFHSSDLMPLTDNSLRRRRSGRKG